MNNTNANNKKNGKTIGEYFMLKPFVAKGSFGEVFKGYKIADPSQQVAIKVVNKEELNKNPKNRENLEYEIGVMQRTDLDREYILQLFSYHQSKQHFYLVLDWMDGGDLSKVIHDQFPMGMPEKYIRKILYQLAAGYRSIRKNKILHRDLKPQNLLLTSKDLDKAVIKIADFGLARDLHTGLATTMCGSPLYMAPEALQGNKYDEKADLWSIGCILYEMFTGTTPYTAQSVPELIKNIQKGALVFPQSVYIPHEAKHLLHCLLHKDPQMRINSDMFWSHPYVQSGAPPKPIVPSQPKPTVETTDEVPSFEPVKPITNNQQQQQIALPPPTNEIPVDQSFVVVDEKPPQVENVQLQPLEQSVREVTAGHVIYAPSIFDFSHVTYDTNNALLVQHVTMAEENARQAWALAECAYLHETYNQKLQALAIYIVAMNFMRKTLESIKTAFGSMPYPERMKSILLWIRTRFVEFAERTQKIHTVVKCLPGSSVCAEELLYKYAIELAKQAGYLEYTNTSPKDVQQMYVRASWVLRYLMTNCEHITTSFDKQTLQTCLKLVTSKMSSTL